MNSLDTTFVVMGLIAAISISILLAKEIYLMNQWKKLRIEAEEIYKQNLNGHELMFELEWLNEERELLINKEHKLFPYLEKGEKNEKGT